MRSSASIVTGGRVSLTERIVECRNCRTQVRLVKKAGQRGHSKQARRYIPSFA
jgi:hypothetical protein